MTFGKCSVPEKSRYWHDLRTQTACGTNYALGLRPSAEGGVNARTACGMHAKGIFFRRDLGAA